ncbi:MAG: TRZ/ATZ family hydrolase [Proteobacteria bacterium]|jgi:5-methylthioadenosine/S-adenosylhomocysteine deaminase|nr:TRZ/ATZ family hydrolase [Pseudomonadota bacterium]
MDTPTNRPPREVDLRIDARWIIPVEPDGVLERHALVADEGRIVALCPQHEADAAFTARTRVACDDHVLIPGLVNAHTHAAMTLLRGIADDVPLETWLERNIWPLEARFVGAEFVRDGAALAVAEMLRGGVTCFNDMYFFPDATADVCDAAGIRAMLGMPVLDFATAWAADADACLQRGFEARDLWKHSPLIVFALAPHAPYTVSDRTWEKIVTYARQLDLPIQTHVGETQRELAQSLEKSGETPLARLDRLGATGPGFIAIHCVHVDAAGIGLLAGQGCHVVHCPASNMKLASGIAPVAAMLDRGVNVALGTDGAASNNRLDVFSEMRLAGLLAKVVAGDASALPAAALLRMATLGGARALGLEGSIGSLAGGKAADAVAVRLGDLETLPVFDPRSHLVHAAGREHVSDVWVAGRRVVEHGALITLDRGAVAARARSWQSRLR